MTVLVYMQARGKTSLSTEPWKHCAVSTYVNIVVVRNQRLCPNQQPLFALLVVAGELPLVQQS